MPEKGVVPENFKDSVIRTHEVAVERGRAGGKKSAEARRRRKSMAEAMVVLLEMPLREGPMTEIHSLEDVTAKGYGKKGANLSINEAIIIAQVREALRGSTKAAKFLAELSSAINTGLGEEDDGFIAALGATAKNDWSSNNDDDDSD